MKAMEKVGIFRLYFLRGHQHWTNLVIQMLQFTLIFFELMWIKLDFVPDWMKSYVVFLVLFGIFYSVGATSVGYWDFHWGTYKASEKRWGEISPNWKKQFGGMTQLQKQNAVIIQQNKAILENLQNRGS